MKIYLAAKVYHEDNLIDAQAYLRFVDDFQKRGAA